MTGILNIENGEAPFPVSDEKMVRAQCDAVSPAASLRMRLIRGIETERMVPEERWVPGEIESNERNTAVALRDRGHRLMVPASE